MNDLESIFADEFKRIEFRYAVEKIKVVVLEDIPRVNITFTDGNPIEFGPHPQGKDLDVPVWLMKILKRKGHVILHRDERTDGTMEALNERKNMNLEGFYYKKTIDWLDSVEKLATKGQVSHTMGKRLRSRFVTFYEKRLKQLLQMISLPTPTILKKLANEEQVLATFIKTILIAWEKQIMERK